MGLRLRETRRFKTKSFVVSFGDLMLPLVGLAAIALLLAAGKIFFFTDLQADSQPIPVTVAPPVTPIPQAGPNTQTQRADASESVTKPLSQTQPVSPPQAPDQRVAAGGNLLLDLSRDNSGSVPQNPNPNDALQNSNSSKEEVREEIIVVQITPPTSTPAQPTQPAPIESEPPSQPSPTKPVESRPVAPKPPQPAQVQPTQARPEATAKQPEKTNWMVQVGAFSTSPAANSVLKQLTQAGHTAIVVPSRTLHRVLVQAGPTKQDALNLATRLGQTGFPGAFVVPPRP